MTSVAEQLQTAQACYEAGQLESARQAYVEILRQEQQNVTAWHRLGMLMYQAGQVDVARDCVEKAIAFGGETPDVCCHLGLIYRAAERLGKAEEWLRRAQNLDPEHWDSLNNLGVVLLEQEQLSDAAALFRRALALQPNDSTARSNLGNVLKEQNLNEEAEREYRTVLAQAPGHVDTINNLAAVLIAMERFEEGITELNRVLMLQPDLVEARVNLGQVLAKSDRMAEAADQFEFVLAKDANSVQAWKGLGEAYMATGQAEAARDAFARVVDLEPDNYGANCNLVYSSQFVPGITCQRMTELYADWDRRLSQPLILERPPLTNDPDPDRKLRLGFVSPNLCAHPALFLTIRAFENIDRTQFETFFYSDRNWHDDYTSRAQACADHWSEVFTLSDTELSTKIHGDAIDILIVMSGHTDANRQRVATRRPAPVQIAWTGDPSGQAAMDYLIADSFLIPDEFDEFYTESVIRLPHDYATFDPPAFAPDPGPCPLETNGYVTFASFNQFIKYHTELLELWAGILQQVPNSRLLLIGKGCEANRETILAPFQAAGVSPDRFELTDMVSRRILIESYKRVDIALDPYPFSGGITTLEALWMGVPVVNLPGETFAGRTSVSHLSNVGLTEVIATSCDEYTKIAVQLAEDPTRLARMRSELRSRVRDSPICDGKQFADDLGSELRSVWRTWVQSVT